MADRAATGAERDDVEAFQRDALSSNGAATAKGGLALQDQRDIGGGAADIEGDEVVPHAALRQSDTGRDAARLDQIARCPWRAARLPRQARTPPWERITKMEPLYPCIGQPPAQPREIPRHDRPDIGIDAAVENRSNSLICGSTSADVVTKTSGSAVRTASAAARSCASSRQECRKQIATASTFRLQHRNGRVQ